LLGWLAGLFGGARAEDGPVDPGKPYVVGERRPEVVPKTPGTILPSIPMIGGGMSIGVGQQRMRPARRRQKKFTQMRAGGIY
jgi:hypothetical protein